MKATEYGVLLFEIPVHEAKAHLKERAEYHTKRNTELLEKAKKIDEDLKRGVEEEEDDEGRMSVKGSTTYSHDARQRDILMASARDQARLAAKFFFLSSHSSGAEGPLYLNTSELVSLEFMKD